MYTLIIQHISTNPDKFEMLRLQDGKRTQPVEIPAPSEFPVQGRPDSNLTQELRWYLESFLDYPFEPDTDVAERVLDSLKKWGETAFNALFDNRDGAKLLDDAVRNGYDKLHLKISSDDPRVLSWNWESLRDPKAGTFAHLCRIERKLNQTLDPAPISEKLPKDCVNILLVTARPFENDVRYRSISRHLIELIETRNLPAEVHVLRPPTFDNLREHLRNHPNFYHILHFDGHGSYGHLNPSGASEFTFKGKEGCLVFEKSDGSEDLIKPDQISSLLRDVAVPAVVLNACQSAMIDQHAENLFSSVASSLLQSGVRSVVAMAYSLYVSAAQVFLPEFYRRLFEDGSMEKAVRAGRHQMLSNKDRVCVRGNFPLEDWLVPVLYQQESVDFSFAAQAKPKAESNRLPPEIEDEAPIFGFIGRDRPILELERALRSPSPGILIHGLGGVGKTTLAKGFVKWLSQTQGLGNGCFWFAFNEIHNAESVINRMGEPLFGNDFSLASLDERMNKLTSAFRQHPFVIVWDNFESVRGIDGTEIRPMLENDQQALLKTFLQKLRNGKTKVIITSRSEENWLKTERRKINIHGLDGEERWLYFNEIVRHLGVRIRRDDPELIELMNMLNGHPLSMQVIISMLETHPAKTLIAALRSGLDSLKQEGDEANARLYATLSLAEKALPEELRPLLILLGLHERFIHLYYFEIMAKQVSESWTTDKIRRFAEPLSHIGLLNDRGQNIYELHPALTGYLRAYLLKAEPEETRDAWTRAFVDVMGTLADELAPKELHEQRFSFHLFGASFYFAMNEAQRIGMDLDFRAILQSLAVYAQYTHSYKEAEDLFLRFAESEKIAGHIEGEVSAYHRLGVNAQEIRAFDIAEIWYRKALEILEKHGNAHRVEETYHLLGYLAYERGNFNAAENWYRKSLEISEKYGSEHGATKTYHHLGLLAEKRGDFNAAGNWYRKSLEISEKHGNEHDAAVTYHELGIIAVERQDFEAAEKWYRKSLEIKEKQGNEHGAAMTYGQFGIISGLKGHFEESGKWLIKAILLFSKCSAPSEVQRNANNFRIFYNQADPETQAKLKALWENAGLGELPSDE